MIANFPNTLFAIVLRRLVVFPLGRPYVVPSDKLGHEVAALLITPSATRDRLTSDVYPPTGSSTSVGRCTSAVRRSRVGEGSSSSAATSWPSLSEGTT